MRSIPQHVHDRARLLATVHPLQTVAELIGVKPSQITKMKQRGWIAPPDGRPERPMPSDFAIVSRHMTTRELQTHYRAGFPSIQRWFSQLPQRRPSWRGRALTRAARVERARA